jgi:hypothetical protein
MKKSEMRFPISLFFEREAKVITQFDGGLLGQSSHIGP